MDTRDLHDLCETLSNEISEVNEKIRQSGGKLSGSDLDYVDKLTHSLKSIKATIAMMEGGYSNDGYGGEPEPVRRIEDPYSGRPKGDMYARRSMDRGQSYRRY